MLIKRFKLVALFQFVHHLPVVQDDRLIGIVTAGDLRAAQPFKATTLSADAWLASLNGTTVAECMTHNPVTIATDASVLDAARQMLAHQIGGLPVVAGARMVGMITEPICCACCSPTRLDLRNSP